MNTPNANEIGAYTADPNLRIMDIQKVGPVIRLRFNTVLGRDYRVDSADEVTGSWNVLFNNITGVASAQRAHDVGQPIPMLLSRRDIFAVSRGNE
jgi:hypothetical protein